MRTNFFSPLQKYAKRLTQYKNEVLWPTGLGTIENILLYKNVIQRFKGNFGTRNHWEPWIQGFQSCLTLVSRFSGLPSCQNKEVSCIRNHPRVKNVDGCEAIVSKRRKHRRVGFRGHTMCSKLVFFLHFYMAFSFRIFWKISWRRITTTSQKFSEIIKGWEATNSGGHQVRTLQR